MTHIAEGALIGGVAVAAIGVAGTAIYNKLNHKSTDSHTQENFGT